MAARELLPGGEQRLRGVDPAGDVRRAGRRRRRAPPPPRRAGAGASAAARRAARTRWRRRSCARRAASCRAAASSAATATSCSASCSRAAAVGRGLGVRELCPGGVDRAVGGVRRRPVRDRHGRLEPGPGLGQLGLAVREHLLGRASAASADRSAASSGRAGRGRGGRRVLDASAHRAGCAGGEAGRELGRHAGEPALPYVEVVLAGVVAALPQVRASGGRGRRRGPAGGRPRRRHGRRPARVPGRRAPSRHGRRPPPSRGVGAQTLLTLGQRGQIGGGGVEFGNRQREDAARGRR